MIKTYFAGQKIPENEQYAYVIGKTGHYIVKRNGLFEACVKIDAIPDLVEQEETFLLKAKRIPYELIKETLVFFHAVYKQHKSEAVVLLCYEQDNWFIYVPEQEVSGASVTYKNDDHKRIVGSIHSHPGFGVFASGTDEKDELNFDGIHVIVSKFDEANPELACYVVINGRRIQVEPETVIEGINEPDKMVNQEWFKKVKSAKEPDRDLFAKQKKKTPKVASGKTEDEEKKVSVDEQCFVCRHEEVCYQDIAGSGQPCPSFDYDPQKAIQVRSLYD